MGEKGVECRERGEVDRVVGVNCEGLLWKSAQTEMDSLGGKVLVGWGRGG